MKKPYASEQETAKFIYNVSKIAMDKKPIVASRMIHEIFDGIVGEIPDRIQCKKGCNWCCHSRVSVTKIELKELAHFIRKNYNKDQMKALRQRCYDYVKSMKGLNADQKLLKRQLCPMNIDGACSVYEARPLKCRSVLSSNADACEKAHNDPSHPVPLASQPKDLANDMQVGMLLAEQNKKSDIDLVKGLMKEFKWN